MPDLFGRRATGPVPAYFEGLSAGTADEQAVAYTWQNDGNVSPAREAALLAEINAYGGRVPEGCTAHITSRVRAGDYDDTALNAANVLKPLPPDQHLATVLWVSSRGFLRLVREGGFIPAQSIDDDGLDSWRTLVQEASSSSAADQRSFLADLLSAANATPSRRDRPTWSTFWRAVEPVLSTPTWADSVRDALGLHHIRNGETLVVLRYEVGTIARLVRPCSLDQPWYPWFFCSPSARMETGYAMSLSTTTALTPEVIHKPPQLDVTMWTGHFDETSADPSDDLRSCRKRHYAALKGVYGAQLKWPVP